MSVSHAQFPIQVLALGDSYTIGTYVSASESWPVQLASALRQEGFVVRDPTITAQNGWTTGDLLNGILRPAPDKEFDLVTLLIGVNNQYQGGDIETYNREFALLLTRATEFAKADPGRVVTLSIPDWGVTPFAEGFNRQRVSQEINIYNSINRQLSLTAGTHYLDITPLSRQHGHDPAYLAEDGLHPSGRMYSAWVKLLMPVAIRILSKR